MVPFINNLQVLEWLDLERNAAILQKTDKKIAQKLRAKNAATSLMLTDEKKSPAEMVTFFLFF